MRKGLSLITGAAVMAISGGSAYAAGPAFGNWSVANGAITLTGTNASGSVVAGGTNGFVQFTVKEGDLTYIGTIVTDADASDASLGFSDESFVLMDFCQGTDCTNNNGIKSQQTIMEDDGSGNTFNSTANIETGTHFGANGAFVRIAQSLNEAESTTGAGDDFMTDFIYEADLNTDGTRDGYIMEIDQVAGLGKASDPSTAGDVQAFTYREAGGSATRAPAIAAMTVNDPNGLGSGGTISSTAGQAVKAVWLGQEIANGGGDFGYLSYDNKDDSLDAVSGFDLTTSAGPGEWNSAFNLQFDGYTRTGDGAPTLNDPSGGLTPN
jgi:hypothetical protein